MDDKELHQQAYDNAISEGYSLSQASQIADDSVTDSYADRADKAKDARKEAIVNGSDRKVGSTIKEFSDFLDEHTGILK